MQDHILCRKQLLSVYRPHWILAVSFGGRCVALRQKAEKHRVSKQAKLNNGEQVVVSLKLVMVSEMKTCYRPQLRGLLGRSLVICACRGLKDKTKDWDRRDG